MNQIQHVKQGIDQLPTPSSASANMDERWIDLITDVQSSIVQGLLPESQAAQTLAWRWLRLASEAGENYCVAVSEMMKPIMQWITISIVHARLALFAQYLSTMELAELQRRQITHVDDWQNLFTEIREQMVAGATVTNHAVRALARRWQTLFRDSYYGENPALEGKIHEALGREPNLLQAIGLNFSMLGFIQSAILLLDRPPHESDNVGPKPSAQRVATLRAAHQLLDSPLILLDPLALKILGDKDEAALRANPRQYDDPMSKGLRATLVVRSRFAEDECEKAAAAGVHQYVVLGAGLDTYAYRSKQHCMHIFEVDLPETQQWKRACLDAADIRIPDTVTYVPTNFEQNTLAQALAEAGFRQDQPAFFSWLGVTMYLDQEAIMETLRYISSCAKGSAVVFDYLVEPSLLTPMERIFMDLVASRVAERGEPWKTYFNPDELAGNLRMHGYSAAHNLDREQLTERYLLNRQDGLSLGNTNRMMHAVV